jgi:hypothetical protein
VNNFVSHCFARNAMCEVETGFQMVLTEFGQGVADHHLNVARFRKSKTLPRTDYLGALPKLLTYHIRHHNLFSILAFADSAYKYRELYGNSFQLSIKFSRPHRCWVFGSGKQPGRADRHSFTMVSYI